METLETANDINFSIQSNVINSSVNNCPFDGITIEGKAKNIECFNNIQKVVNFGCFSGTCGHLNNKTVTPSGAVLFTIYVYGK